MSNTRPMRCPPAFRPVLPLARACRDAGGRVLVVGGAVRDMLLSREQLLSPAALQPGEEGGIVDLDLEVHGLPAERLQDILGRFGPVNLVGQAFAVYKLDLGGLQVDVALPRRDSKVGAGHRGIAALGDPWLGIRAAARRRDLTVNALAFDPLTGAVEDPWGGVADLRRRVLRAVDPASFGEDPLRALRVPQLAARFQFQVDDSLVALCAAMPVAELPPERVRAELRKLLLLSAEPSWGLRVGLRSGLWWRLHPGLDLDDWEPVYAAVNRAARLRERHYAHDVRYAEALLLVALLHSVPAEQMEDLLDRIDVYRQGGFPLRLAVLSMREQICSLDPAASDGQLRLTARAAESSGGLGLWLAAAQAVSGDARFGELASRARELGVQRRAPERLVHGRHLLSRGHAPGPGLGELLEILYHRQLSEGIEDQAVLLAELEEA